MKWGQFWKLVPAHCIVVMRKDTKMQCARTLRCLPLNGSLKPSWPWRMLLCSEVIVKNSKLHAVMRNIPVYTNVCWWAGRHAVRRDQLTQTWRLQSSTLYYSNYNIAQGQRRSQVRKESRRPRLAQDWLHISCNCLPKIVWNFKNASFSNVLLLVKKNGSG